MTSFIEVIEQGEILQVEIQDEGFTITIDGDEKSPAVATEIENEKNSRQDMLTDNCGNTERRTSEKHPVLLTVQGIVTKDRSDSSNLAMQDLRDTLVEGQVYDVESDIFSGEIELTNIVITQTADINSFQKTGTGEKKKAYSFQLQFGENESETE